MKMISFDNLLHPYLYLTMCNPANGAPEWATTQSGSAGSEVWSSDHSHKDTASEASAAAAVLRNGLSILRRRRWCWGKRKINKNVSCLNLNLIVLCRCNILCCEEVLKICFFLSHLMLSVFWGLKNEVNKCFFSVRFRLFVYCEAVVFITEVSSCLVLYSCHKYCCVDWNPETECLYINVSSAIYLRLFLAQLKEGRGCKRNEICAKSSHRCLLDQLQILQAYFHYIFIPVDYSTFLIILEKWQWNVFSPATCNRTVHSEFIPQKKEMFSEKSKQTTARHIGKSLL